jgi:hypothetical protein
MALVKPLHSGDPNVMRSSHAATCICSDLYAYATVSHSATIPHRDLGGAVAAQAEIPITYFGMSYQAKIVTKMIYLQYMLSVHGMIYCIIHVLLWKIRVYTL